MVIAGALSGALAGLAGATEVAGLKGYLTADMSRGFGYAGIVVAMIAGLDALAVVPAAIFIAGIFVGADTMSRAIGVSNYIADLIVALVASVRAGQRPVRALPHPVSIMDGVLDILLSASFWAAAIRIATPYMFGVLGALLCERSGVLNLGIEGIFTAGAMAGWMSVYLGADLWTGVLIAALTGATIGLLLALLTVPLGLSQHVTGIGITLFATSSPISSIASRCRTSRRPPTIVPFRPLNIPGLSDLPFIGPALFQQTPLTFLAFALFGVVAFVLYRTPLGLAIRAVGENPAAVEAQGLNVVAIRIGTVVAGSALMALGGAFLTMSAFNAFFFEMTNGRGWICIALTVFASWRPGKALLGALLFGAFDAFQLRLQHQVGGAVPGQVFLMLPYLLSIAALVVIARSADYPKALMMPYFKDQR